MNITDIDRGYWIAIQDVLTADFRPDKQGAKSLIKRSGFTYEMCCQLMEEFDSNRDILKEVVNDIFNKD